MKKVILHVGMHKTDSSSIQHSLGKSLTDENFFYFDLGEVNHSGPMVNMFSKRAHIYHGNIKRGRSKQDILEIRERLKASFREQLDNLGERTGIISAEDLCNFRAPELQDLKDFIGEDVEIELYCYIRQPSNYMASAFQQLVKGGKSDFSLQGMYPGYSKLNHHIKVFGEQQCKFIPFERSELYQEDVVYDFCHRTGIGADKIKHLNVNESISPIALKVLYTYRKHNPKFGIGKNSIPENNYLIKRLSVLKDQRKLVTSKAGMSLRSLKLS